MASKSNAGQLGGAHFKHSGRSILLYWLNSTDSDDAAYGDPPSDNEFI